VVISLIKSVIFGASTLLFIACAQERQPLLDEVGSVLGQTATAVCATVQCRKISQCLTKLGVSLDKQRQLSVLLFSAERLASAADTKTYVEQKLRFSGMHDKKM